MDKKIEELIVQFKELIASGKEKCEEKEYGDAYDDFEKAFEVAKAINKTNCDANVMVRAYNNLATANLCVGFIDDALEEEQKALEFVSKCNNLEDKLVLYKNLGSIYSFLENYEKSYEYYSKALIVRKKMFESDSKAEPVIEGLDEVANVLIKSRKFSEAKEYARTANEIRQELYGNRKDKTEIALGLSFYAHICEEEGELEEAKWYRFKEYETYEGMNNKGGMIKALEKIEVLCLALKDYNGAERVKVQIRNLYYK